MVSMTKTQLTIRQNVKKKNKIKKFSVEKKMKFLKKMSKKPRAVVPKTTSDIKISNFITFATTDSIGVLFKRSC